MSTVDVLVFLGLAFDDSVSYGKWIAAQLNVIAVTGFIVLSPRSPTHCGNYKEIILLLTCFGRWGIRTSSVRTLVESNH